MSEAAGAHGSRRAPGGDPGGSAAAQPDAALPTQPSLRRMRAFGVRPKRDLGQNFLIDSNILDVIGRAAELAPDDAVLEIGGGLGVLSEHLAERCAHVHVVEIDRSLEPALRDALDPFGGRATLHLADALALDLAALEPRPTKVVANLPYGIAASAILRTIDELPTVARWVAMVQKEVGERFAAAAGTAAYGVPSALAQLACDVRVLRPISRQVFHPVPNVDSVLVGLERRADAPAVPPALRAFVQGAFAHRRKALARSAELAGVATRDDVRAALAELGEPPDVRAERLSPRRLRELWELVDRARSGGAADDQDRPGKEGADRAARPDAPVSTADGRADGEEGQ